ncbi:peptidase inhibitor family I36 protein [Streptomyces laculatispora]|uniref:peptidase inhibitor family I36 protein n=1 Tax=Streptomyces laculatispora TaxID=887464 RepID=UPI001A9514D4|nr:peptidase inhibitor family I36 protein [Streptomyces laculatispora]MBO0914792.1 peptidase inhibitor family I36 protein [Streptomyces laculatispora]
MRITVSIVAAAALLLPAGAAVASPVPQSAAATAVCSIDHFCLYEYSDGTGRRGSYLNGTDDVKRQNLPSVRSAWNRTNQYWCVWSQAEYMGTKVIVQPNEGLRQLGGAFRSALPASAARC